MDATDTPLRSRGTYETGHRNLERSWDGEAWAGPVVEVAGAPALGAPRSFARMLRRSPVWWAVGGALVGLGLSILGVVGSSRVTALLVVGGLVATGGPILALILGVRRRLAIERTEARRATLAGLGAGVVAVLVALGIERLVEWGLGVREGAPSEAMLLLAGPIEEGAKLLVPVVLLVAGAPYIRSPRLGVWAVLLASGIFGAVEGALYAANLGGERTIDPGETLTKDFPGLSPTVADATAEGVSVIARIWVELGHPLWTTGAAVIIWLAAHKSGRVLAWPTLGAILAAAALHSFNDGVLPRLPGVLPDVASLLWITLSYVLWFRPLVRRLVPPDALRQVPVRWLPPVPRSRTQS